MSILIYFAIPIFNLTMIAEFFYIRRFATTKAADAIGYEPKDTATSLVMGIGNVLESAALKPIIALPAHMWLYENYALFPEFFSHIHWYAWLILFFADEHCYYWFHRVSHEQRWAWAAHVNHHSSEHYNLSTALRQSWSTFFYHWMFYIPLPILGFHPAMMATMAGLSLLYQYWIHTETIGNMGWFEKFFNTPSHHRVHHGSNEQYLDKNYGGFLIAYDKLYGTFEPENERVKYGLVHNIKTFNPIKVAFHEWAALFNDMWKSKSLVTAVKYWFKPPGWQPAERASDKPTA